MHRESQGYDTGSRTRTRQGFMQKALLSGYMEKVGKRWSDIKAIITAILK